MALNPIEYPASKKYQYLFTIFIPTYNRARLLPRVFDSIEQQTYRDFEVLIVDDGSTDETLEVVEQWASAVDFPVNYVWQENQGKPAAYNSALDRINGYFMLVLDSDDVLALDALAILKSSWEQIPQDQRSHFAGVEGLSAFMRDRRIAGDRFPQDVMDSDFLEISYKYNVRGDKKHAMRTDVAAQFPFPIYPGEKHMRESVIWCRIAHHYKFRYTNEIIQYIEQQPDGLTAKPFARRVSSPNNFRIAFQEMVNDHCRFCSFSQRYKFMLRYIRYSCLAKVGLGRQCTEIKSHWLWLLAMPQGLLDALRDNIKVHYSDAG